MQRRGKLKKRRSREGKDEGREWKAKGKAEKEGRVSRELGTSREKERQGKEGKWREGGKQGREGEGMESKEVWKIKK